MLFPVHEGAIFGEIVARGGVQLDTWKLHVLTDMPSPNNEKSFNNF